ncbi:hypothetical protein GCM10010992_15890 [Cloacibacterium rupense]|uniref:Uncharacterized protein n=1 Tax=Cloacibacterium rupense TaxID=517423 RepID=A0ABQ2NII5_9FLAO|nr:hypothetical protein GCM10010992_15890 [Cloacibacterium rupense]
MTGMPTNEVFPKPAHMINAPITECFQLKIFPKTKKNKMAANIPIQGTAIGNRTLLLIWTLEI